MRLLKQLVGLGVRLPFVVVALLLWLWCIGALAYCGGGGASGRGAAVLLFSGVYLGIWIFAPRYRKFLGLLLAALPVMLWFASIRPDPETVYQTPWARQCRVTLEGNRVTLDGIRDFHYRSEQDYDVRYRTETYDLDQAETLYLAVSHWDGLQAIAHTMLSFGFADGRYVVLSVETRVPEGREQGTIAGLFKQYGLGMIFGTESDLLKLRATHRGETLYLYPTTASPEMVRTAFLNLVRRAQKLYRQPEFYNTLTSNCTTVLIPPLRPILLGFRVDYRSIFNGLIDSLAFEKGYLAAGGEQDEAFDNVKNRHRIRAGHAEEGAAYSAAIRRDIGEGRAQD